MKATITKVSDLGYMKTAVLTIKKDGKDVELGVTDSNSSWDTVFGKDGKAGVVGATMELDETLIQKSPAGNYFINRITATGLAKKASWEQAKADIAKAEAQRASYF